jgi:leucine dehydrogenase
MGVFSAVDFDHHETVAYFDDKRSGLKTIIAVHSTALGAGCGGCRMYPYASEDAALTDVLRLSRGMSYKSAIADLPLGGGKAVIIGDPKKDKSEAMLTAFAEAVNALGGRYITAMDVGMTPADLPIVARHTHHVAGYDQAGKSGGDSGPATALGVYLGIKAAVKHRLKTDSVSGLTVAIQGVGKVGMKLAEKLYADGARLIVADVNTDLVAHAVSNFGAQTSGVDEIVTAECDVLSPNALGAILNDGTVPRIKAKVIGGAANNQLARDENGRALKDRGILYAPDYVINGGGIICVAGQIYNWSNDEIDRRVRNIPNTLGAIFARSEADGESTHVIADRMAEARMTKGQATKAAAAAA